MEKPNNINVKSKYDSAINELHLNIKSIKQLHSSSQSKHEITILKQRIIELKKEYKNLKKEIYSENRKKVANLNVAYKSLKVDFNNSKHTSDNKTYNNLKKELENLRIRKKTTINNKIRQVYGTTAGRTKNEIYSKFLRIGFILLLFMLFIVPFWLIITYSTKTSFDASDTSKFKVFIPSTNGGAKVNYETAFKALKFWETIFNTLFLTIASNVIILLFASMAAWQLVRKQTWYSKVLFYFFIVAMILPFQSIMMPLVSQFNKTNLRGTLFGTMIAYIGFGVALSIFMMHGFLKTVPQALEESAAISGMKPYQIFFHVVLPLLRTTFITIMVLNIMWIWNDYLLPSLLLDDQYGPQTLQVRLINVLAQTVAQDMKAISAGVVILVLPPIAFFIFAQKKMISGITKGAIK